MIKQGIITFIGVVFSVLLLSFFTGCSEKTSGNPPEQNKFLSPWWRTAEYEPKDTTIESVPLNQINGQWVKASALKKEMLSPEVKEYIDKLPAGFAFSQTGDFNHDKIPDKACVGVYLDKSGKQGTFLLILTQTNTEKWQKAFLLYNEGKPGFSILCYVNGDLFYGDCFKCDTYYKIAWDGKTYVLKSDIDNN